VASCHIEATWTEGEVRKMALKVAGKLADRLGGDMTAELALSLFQDAMKSVLDTVRDSETKYIPL
jgi:hypothetical protein